MSRDRGGPDDDDLVAGRRPVLELLRAGGSVERVLLSQDLRTAPILRDIRSAAEEASVPVRVVPKDEVERIARGLNHQGVVARTARYRYTPFDELLSRPAPALLFLDGITDPHNLGSLLRSADGAGFDGVVLPARRSSGVTASVRRVSAGAAEVVPVARVTNLARALDQGKEAGLWIVGLDERGPTDLWSSDLVEPPVGVLLGAEDRGISRVAKDRCDELVRISLRGRLSSLNVAVAGALAMFEVARRRGDQSSSL